MCNTLRTVVKLATLEASTTDVRRDETSGDCAEETNDLFDIFKRRKNCLKKLEDERTVLNEL